MNKNTLINVAMFMVGAAVGSVATWKLLETKYERLIQEEIDSIKDEYDKFYRDTEEDDLVAESDVVESRSEVPETLANAYAKVLSDTGYAGRNVEEKEVDDHVDKPYVITPDEYDELDGYATCTLYCYADNVITDEHDNIIENAEELIGEDIASHFGEYEDDSVFVRNDAHKCDYEILRDFDNYHDKYSSDVED